MIRAHVFSIEKVVLLHSLSDCRLNAQTSKTAVDALEARLRQAEADDGGEEPQFRNTEVHEFLA